MTPATSAVTVRTCPNSRAVPVWSFSPPMIEGLTNRMYDIVRNVARPAMISVRTVEPRSEMWKYRSSPDLGAVPETVGAIVAINAPFRARPGRLPRRLRATRQGKTAEGYEPSPGPARSAATNFARCAAAGPKGLPERRARPAERVSVGDQERRRKDGHDPAVAVRQRRETPPVVPELHVGGGEAGRGPRAR